MGNIKTDEGLKRVIGIPVENPRKLTPSRQMKVTPVGHFKLTPCLRLKLTP